MLLKFESPEYTADIDAIGTLRFWRLFVSWVSKRRQNSTKLYFGALWLSSEFHKRKQHRFTHVLPMRWLNFIQIDW